MDKNNVDNVDNLVHKWFAYEKGTKIMWIKRKNRRGQLGGYCG